MSPDDVSQIVQASRPDVLAQDEGFWSRFYQEYDRDESFVQLNFGYYHPALRAVLDVELNAARELNRRGAHFKTLDSASLLESTRRELADIAGADPEEVAITRNASEALNIIINGLSLRPGDEVVATDQDYTAANQAWDQRVLHDGICVRRVPLPIDPADDEEILRAFASAISPRTRVLFLTHAIHITGQILPAEKICALARERGIPVLVDAAHSFAQVEFSIRNLQCEFLVASLHKWLGAPLGTGMLFVRKDRIPELRPLFGDTQHANRDIRRFERFGNRPDSLNAGLREAIRWHRALGTAVKRERLSYLHRCWAEPLRSRTRFRILTPRAKERHGAIGLMSLGGVPAERVQDYLFTEHRLFTATHKLGDSTGVRITPGLATSTEHITRLLHALESADIHFAHAT